MMTDRPTSRHRRLLDRLASVTIVVVLSMAAMPVTGFAAGLPSAAKGRTPFALLDLSQLGEALGRGELPVEVLVAGSLVALAVGLVLSLLVATLRQRRHRSVPAPEAAPVEPAEDGLHSRTTLPWPAQDSDGFRVPSPPTASSSTVDAEEPMPFRRDERTPPLDAARAEAWAARAASIEAAGQPSAWPPGAEEAIDLEEPGDSPWAPISPSTTGGSGGTEAPTVAGNWGRAEVELASTSPAAVAPHDTVSREVPPARSPLGTPQAPLVVELHDERETAADRRVRPNLPLVVAIGTIAVGVAFSAGAAVGATLGVGAGAAIGLAFAGGAGVAIGATVALLGGGRR